MKERGELKGAWDQETWDSDMGPLGGKILFLYFLQF